MQGLLKGCLVEGETYRMDDLYVEGSRGSPGEIVSYALMGLGQTLGSGL